VNFNAPYASRGWHCSDGNDLMCRDDGALNSPFTQLCPRASNLEGLPIIDCNKDNYFSVQPAVGSWLYENPAANIYNSQFLVSCSNNTICVASAKKATSRILKITNRVLKITANGRKGQVSIKSKLILSGTTKDYLKGVAMKDLVKKLTFSLSDSKNNLIIKNKWIEFNAAGESKVFLSNLKKGTYAISFQAKGLTDADILHSNSRAFKISR